MIIYMYFFDNKKHHKPHIHKEELMADWKLAVEGKDVFNIEPPR